MYDELIEEWRPVSGFEGLYEVSNTGTVKRLAGSYQRNGHSVTINEKIMSPKSSKNGYVFVTLSKNGQHKQQAVHRLVADAFLPNPNGSKQVCHIDGNGANNRLENLRWGRPVRKSAADKASRVDLPGEEWRDIAGYEGLYQVSSYGRIYSIPRRRTCGGILKQAVGSTGYYFVSLMKDCKSKSCRVHRIVAESFIPNPKKLGVVNHKDEDKLNNNVDNLEWCDMKYNTNYGTGIERARSSHCKPVIQYTLDGKFVGRWKSVHEACMSIGASKSSISMACRRKGHNLTSRGIAHGYRWDFEGVDYGKAS